METWAYKYQSEDFTKRQLEKLSIVGQEFLGGNMRNSIPASVKLISFDAQWKRDKFADYETSLRLGVIRIRLDTLGAK